MTVKGVTSTKWVHNSWLTVGPPIWVSLSLIGRGTNIWPVIPVIWNSGKCPIVDGAPLSILKNAWRNSERTGEAFGDVLFDAKNDIADISAQSA